MPSPSQPHLPRQVCGCLRPGACGSSRSERGRCDGPYGRGSTCLFLGTHAQVLTPRSSELHSLQLSEKPGQERERLSVSFLEMKRIERRETPRTEIWHPGLLVFLEDKLYSFPQCLDSMDKHCERHQSAKCQEKRVERP